MNDRLATLDGVKLTKWKIDIEQPVIDCTIVHDWDDLAKPGGRLKFFCAVCGAVSDGTCAGYHQSDRMTFRGTAAIQRTAVGHQWPHPSRLTIEGVPDSNLEDLEFNVTELAGTLYFTAFRHMPEGYPA